MRKISAKFVPRGLREDLKERSGHDSREMVELINSNPAVLNALVTCDEIWIYRDQRPRDRVPSGSMLALPDPRRPDRVNPPTNIWWSLFWQHWHDLHALGSHWTDSQQGISCWGFKGVQDEIRSEESCTLQIGSVAFPSGHQLTTPTLSQTIWLRWASRQFLSLLRVQTLLPVTFGYCLSPRKNLEAVVMRQLRRWKRLWWRSLTRSHKRISRSCWHGTTSALQPEEITSKRTRVSYVYY